MTHRGSKEGRSVRYELGLPSRLSLTIFSCVTAVWLATPLVSRGADSISEEELWDVCVDAYLDCQLNCKDLPDRCEAVCDGQFDDCVNRAPISGASQAYLWRQGFFPEILPSRKQTGDFDGDGLEDFVVFLNTTYTDARRGDVYVALSDGLDRFHAPSLWNGWFCAYGSQICEVGDFDGDGRDDVYSLTRGDGAGRGYVQVARSTGTGFTAFTAYVGQHGRDWRDLDVADMDGDGREDAVLFGQGTASTEEGDVVVLLSNGTNALEAQTTGGSFPGCAATLQGCNQPVVAHPVWHGSFCYDGDACFAGDLDGDGKGDLVAFRPSRGDVIYTACGYSYASRRHTCFSVPSPLPFPIDLHWATSYGFADADGDGQADLVSFDGSGRVRLGTGFLLDRSSGSPALELTVTDGPFECAFPYPQACQLSDVNGDAQADLVEFTLGPAGLGVPGDVWVTVVPFSDSDGDRVPDEIDNCLFVSNPDQADADGDEIGDVCRTDCSDGLDNDRDGVADVDDPGCSDAGDLSERTPLVECDDGVDNDGDEVRDHPADPECASPADRREARTQTSCGLGFEQSVLLPLLMALRRRRNR